MKPSKEKPPIKTETSPLSEIDNEPISTGGNVSDMLEIPTNGLVYHSVTFCGKVYMIPEENQKLADNLGFAVIWNDKRFEPSRK